MRLLLFCLLACPALYAQSPNTYKGIKQLSAHTQTKTEKKAILEYEWHFDKNGNKIKYNHPTHYCTQTWTYNAQNKVAVYDVMCGESMSNGTTTYTYSPQMTVSQEVTGSYKRTTTDSLDAQKNVRSRHVAFDYEVEDEKKHTVTYTSFVYNAKNQVTSTETTTNEGNKIRQQYTYKNDSLQLLVRVVAGKKDTLLLQDFYRDSKLLASKKYPIFEDDSKKGYYQELFEYDQKGRVLKWTKNIKSATDCPNPKLPCAMEMIEYTYVGDKLSEVHAHFYQKGVLLSHTTTKYDKGIEREKRTIDAKNDLIEFTVFKTVKW